MYYLHILDTHVEESQIKSLFLEEKDCYKVAKLISINEPDNIIIINSIEKDMKYPNKRKIVILHVFINGNEDIEYNNILRIDKKNT